MDNDRDRLIIKVMGYGGRRGGEVGGVTGRDILRRDRCCELRVHQQVVRIGRAEKITRVKTDAAQRNVPRARLRSETIGHLCEDTFET